jgi:predicted enzyme related to lactoylglutathione lyase
MHHSRFSAVIIDCQTSDPRGAARFWSEAFGRPAIEDPADRMYVSLQMHADEVNGQVQAVAHESRVHLDIETDDVDAEVARLGKLGAREVECRRTWVVMDGRSDRPRVQALTCAEMFCTLSDVYSGQ